MKGDYWHVHAERGDDQVVDVPGCSEEEADFWKRNLVRAQADVMVTGPDGSVMRFSGERAGR